MYLYNGKELQDDLDLGLYDYGARMYDPTLGRWNAVDPLADLYYSATPYNYVLNTPTNAIDPDGMSCVGCNNGENVSGDPRRGLTSNGGGGKTVNGGTKVKDTDGEMVEMLPTALITPKGSVVPDADVHEWSYTGSYADYQNQYPTYAGMSHAEALGYWDTHHKAGFYAQWDAEVSEERARIAVQKMAWFLMVAPDVMGVSMGSLSRGVASPRQFSYSPRGGRDIVGSGYDDVLPTQDWINPAKVRHYQKLIEGGHRLRPVEAYRQGGKLFIEDGHHRFVAHIRLGIRPNMYIGNTGGPVGLRNWKPVSYQRPTLDVDF